MKKIRKKPLSKNQLQNVSGGSQVPMEGGPIPVNARPPLIPNTGHTIELPGSAESPKKQPRS